MIMRLANTLFEELHKHREYYHYVLKNLVVLEI